MYGKIFASTFTGSMVGMGSDVFAVWAYALANADAKGFVELNSRLLAAVIGSTQEAMQIAIEKLEAPDPGSRNAESGGRRITRCGQFLFHIVNHGTYRGIRDADDRREYQRKWAKDKRAVQTSTGVDQSRPESTQVEEEVEEEERQISLAGTGVPARANHERRARYSPAFEAVWSAYGRKVEKRKAYKAWGESAKTEGGEERLRDLVLAALKWQAPIWAKDSWRFAKYLERYLKARKWEDEPPSGKTGTDGFEWYQEKDFPSR